MEKIYHYILGRYKRIELKKMNLYDLIRYNDRSKNPIGSNKKHDKTVDEIRSEIDIELITLRPNKPTGLIKEVFRLFNIYSKSNRNCKKMSLLSIILKYIESFLSEKESDFIYSFFKGSISFPKLYLEEEIIRLFKQDTSFKKEYLKALTNMGDRQLEEISPQAKALLSNPNCSLINKFIENNPVKYRKIIGS